MRVKASSRIGTVGGVLAATSVAAWFLIIDFLRGKPFFVPAELGRMMFHVLGITRPLGSLAYVAAYTVFHYAAFIVVGMLAAMLAERAKEQQSVLAGAALLFAVFEAAFTMLMYILATVSAIGFAAWYQIAIGNALAALVMTVYLLRAYPRLLKEVKSTLAGQDDAVAGNGIPPTVSAEREPEHVGASR